MADLDHSMFLPLQDRGHWVSWFHRRCSNSLEDDKSKDCTSLLHSGHSLYLWCTQIKQTFYELRRNISVVGTGYGNTEQIICYKKTSHNVPKEINQTIEFRFNIYILQNFYFISIIIFINIIIYYF